MNESEPEFNNSSATTERALFAGEIDFVSGNQHFC